MEQAINALVRTLRLMDSVLDEFLDLSDIKRLALVKNDLDKVNNIIKSELELNARFSNLEKNRQELTKQISGDANTALSNIISSLTGGLKIELEACGVALNKKLIQQKKANQFNVELINNHLSYVDYMMNIFTGNQKRSSAYTPSGYSQYNPKGRALFENKV